MEGKKMTDLIPLSRTHYWGAPQTRGEIAPGIVWISTASHGGIVLSDRRQAEIPAFMRVSEGVYEEDCDWCIPVLIFQAEVRAGWLGAFDNGDVEQALIGAEETLRHWHPERWEQHYSRALLPGESHKRDEATDAAKHKGCWRLVSACGSWAEGVDEGMIGICARVDGFNNRNWLDKDRYFLATNAQHQAIVADRHWIFEPEKLQEVDRLSFLSKSA
jgi:hypothetical protein